MFLHPPHNIGYRNTKAPANITTAVSLADNQINASRLNPSVQSVRFLFSLIEHPPFVFIVLNRVSISIKPLHISCGILDVNRISVNKILVF